MAGKIKQLIDELIDQRSRGNEAMRYFIRSHLILKGINPDQYTSDSPDDPVIIAKLEEMLRAQEE